VVIRDYSINGYYIGGYWWLLVAIGSSLWLLYWWLLVTIVLVVIGGYSINGCWWLFY